MIPPEINDYGGAPVATHNHACPVCLWKPSVFNLSTGRMEPCWEPLPPFVDTCIEHGPGAALRLPFQIRVF